MVALSRGGHRFSQLLLDLLHFPARVHRGLCVRDGVGDADRKARGR